MKKRLNENIIYEAIQNVLNEYFSKQGSLFEPVEDEDDDEKYDVVTLGDDPNVRSGRAWHEKMGNFPVIRDGKTFYVSRSMGISLFCFCKDRAGRWCILASKRGPKAGGQTGLWNVVRGFLDYGETAEECAQRECREETGVNVPLELIQQQGINTGNLGGAQNVTIRFAAVLDKTTDAYPVSMANCEDGEVSDVAWVPIEFINKDNKVFNFHNWAFRNDGVKTLQQAETTLGYDIDTKTYNNNLDYKINALKSMLRGKDPKAYQIFLQVIDELKNSK